MIIKPFYFHFFQKKKTPVLCIRRGFSFMILLFLCTIALGQESFLSMNRDIMNRYDLQINRVGSDFHTDIKPYRYSELKSITNLDSIDNSFYWRYNPEKRRPWIMRKMRVEHLIRAKTEDFQINIDPVVNFELTQSGPTKENGFVNTRGFMIQGSIGKNVSFATSFFENQATFVSYIDAFIAQRRVIPGQGVPKNFKGSIESYDYGIATGYFSYTPVKQINIQFGNEKNFFGEGYRSLLLSDNAFPYPFFKITTSFWKIKYINLYTTMTDLSSPKNAWNVDDFHRKYISIHYLSYNVLKRVTVGFFEAIVVRPKDSTEYRGFNWNYINPIIYARTDEFNPHSSDNSLIGMNLKFKFSSRLIFYGQFIIDEINLKESILGNQYYGNRQGYQLGFKYLNAFSIKNLNWRCEYNYVRPFTYSHSNPLQSYTHYSQELAHPIGANFWEALSFINYRFKSWIFEGRISTLEYGADVYNSTTKKFDNTGKNIFRATESERKSNYGYKVGGGTKTTIGYTSLRVQYVINIKSNLVIEGGLTLRDFSNSLSVNSKSAIIHFGLRTSIQNFYYDF